MKNTIFTTVFLIFAASFTFAATPPEDFVGIYGVSSTNPNDIELVLKDNMHFTYTDHSNPDKAIDVSGTWKVENGKVILSTNEKSPRFHKKWKIDENTAKSRLGICFYTLRRKK